MYLSKFFVLDDDPPAQSGKPSQCVVRTKPVAVTLQSMQQFGIDLYKERALPISLRVVRGGNQQRRTEFQSEQVQCASHHRRPAAVHAQNGHDDAAVIGK